MNKAQYQMKKAKKAGLSPLDVLRMKEIARRETMKMEQEATEKAFLQMLSIPLAVLANDYWEKTAKKRIPKFIEDVSSLYVSYQEGIVTDEDLASMLYEYAGVKVEAEWINAKSKEGE